MKIQIVKNKYINAGLLLMLVSAMAHMVVLIIIAIFSRDVHVLNYFYILQLQNFLPDFFSTGAGDIISFFFVIILYIIIFYGNKLNHD